MMEKYTNLLNKKINVEYDGNFMNSYKITSMAPTQKVQAGRGKLYFCSVEWEKKGLPGTYPTLFFDAQTLNDLITKNCAMCPFMPQLWYVCKEN